MNVYELDITVFDPKTATSNEWDAVDVFKDAMFQEINPDDPLPPHEIRQKMMRQKMDEPSFMTKIWIVWTEDNRIAGMFSIEHPRHDSPDYEEQKNMVFARIEVAGIFRRQGLGTRMLGEIVKECRQLGDHVQWIQLGSETASGHAFAEHYGATVAWVGKENRLYAEDIDWDMVQQWNTDGSVRAPDVTIELFDGLIEKDLEAFCALYTELENQQPLGEMEGAQFTYTPEIIRHEHENAVQMGNIWTTAITREADGTISGLTDIIYNPQRPHRILIELTGVKDVYRGRGLGKWLKSAMMLHIRQTYPEFRYIATSNADNNAPMLSINERLGFKPYKEGRLYKVSVADVADKI